MRPKQKFRKRKARSRAKRSKLAENESKKAAAQATVLQRQAELWAAKKRADRTAVLAGRASVSQQEADDDKARVEAYDAAISAAKAQVTAAEAAIATARSEVLEAESSYQAAVATVQRIQADIDDSDLKAPVDGRIQYRVAQPLEVVQAGGRVLNMIDLNDVYMTFFLPTKEVGRVPLGSEVRIVLDAVPQYVIPAKVTFVADVAQFTPKTVETASEREKLTFRLKANIPKDAAAEICQGCQDRAARRGLCAAGSERPLAGQPEGEAAHAQSVSLKIKPPGWIWGPAVPSQRRWCACPTSACTMARRWR